MTFSKSKSRFAPRLCLKLNYCSKPRHHFITQSKLLAFTIVELLVVIVVIGILAGITILSYSGVQTRAQVDKMKSDINQLSRVVQIARLLESKTLGQITTSYYSAGGCFPKPTGTDLAALPETDACWVSYNRFLNNVSVASGVNIRSIVDPWGRPYAVDENEGEGSVGCSMDSIRAFSYPFVTNTSYYPPSTTVQIPLSGFSGCL